MKRTIVPERLDSDSGSARQIETALVDLRHINRWFGGVGTTVTLVRQIASEQSLRQLSLLEVGAGSGDVPLAARRELAKLGLNLDVVLLDRMTSHLRRNEVPAVCADALHLPFREDAFDLVSCSLFAHHLEPDELKRFVTDALRVCRCAVLINDLIRSRVHLGLVRAGLPLFRSPITWHDAPASVRRAYTVEEMRDILCDVQAQRLNFSRHYLYRMGVVAWKKSKEHSSLGLRQ